MVAAKNLYPKITEQPIFDAPIAPERIEKLSLLKNYIESALKERSEVQLNFICTHNSRRSHMAQIWAQCMAFHHQINGVHCYSAGTERTALFPTVIHTLQKQGFVIKALDNSVNPKYEVRFSEQAPPLIAFSKTIHEQDINKPFAAVMTCSDADQNCPVIPGAEKRIPLTYQDPKVHDGTEVALEKYMERSIQIANEINWVFQNLKTS